MSVLSPEQIAKLLAGAQRRGGARQRRPKKHVRDTETWFGLEHDIKSSCEVPDHEDRIELFDFASQDTLEKAKDRRRVVATVNNVVMCRYCYLSGAAPDPSDAA